MKQLCLRYAGDVQKVCEVKAAQWLKCSKQGGQAEEYVKCLLIILDWRLSKKASLWRWEL